jgi:predicted MFS family arabinose efflux permease
LHLPDLTCLQIDLATSKVGLSSDEATWGLSVIGILSTVGRLSGGVLAQRLQRHRVKMGAAGIIGAGVALMLIPVAGNFAGFLVLCCCLGFVGAHFARVPAHTAIAGLRAVFSYPTYQS